jgi:hypothetical protein
MPIVDKPLLVRALVRNRDGLVVMERRCRVGEIDSVLPQIGDGLV